MDFREWADLRKMIFMPDRNERCGAIGANNICVCERKKFNISRDTERWRVVHVESLTSARLIKGFGDVRYPVRVGRYSYIESDTGGNHTSFTRTQP